MSLYAFEHSGAYHAIFSLFFITMAAMLILSCVTLYRAFYGNISQNVKKLNIVRILTTFCIVVQYITFIGYYIRDPFVHESLWNVWIPAFTIALTLLSYNISIIYLETISVGRKIAKKKKKKKNSAKVVWTKDEKQNEKIQQRINSVDPTMSISNITQDDSYEFDDDSDDDYSNFSASSTNNSESSRASSKLFIKEKIKPIFWKCIWILWISCAVSNWLGSILGWGFNILLAQAFFYMLWKLISFIMLSFCVYILYVVKQRLEHVLENTDINANKKINKSLIEGRRRIKNLIICESVLIFVFGVSVIYEIYVMIVIASGNIVKNIYAQSTLMSMVAYFPIWSIIHAVLLIYSWISKSTLKSKQKKNKKQSEQNDANSTEIVEIRKDVQ
eukprot:177147_1